TQVKAESASGSLCLMIRIQRTQVETETSTSKSGGDGLGPVGEVIKRLGVRGIEMQRRDRHRAGKNRRVIRVRLNLLVDALLEQPEITAPARIFSFAQLVTRDFL